MGEVQRRQYRDPRHDPRLLQTGEQQNGPQQVQQLRSDEEDPE